MLTNAHLIGSSLILCSTFLAGISQIMLKLSAQKEYRNGLMKYLNPNVIIAYGIFVLTTILSAIAVRFVPLSYSAALGVSGQIFVPVMSYFILKEQISKRRLLGMSVIIVGVVIFSL